MFEKEVSKKIKQIITVLLVFGVVVACCTVQVVNFINRDTTELSVDGIREEILPVAKLSIYEYNFTEILYYSDTNKVFGYDIPFSKNRYIATIDGTVAIGIDVEKIECIPKMNNGVLKKVDIKIPSSEPLYVVLDKSSLQIYENKSGLFNAFTSDDYNDQLIEVENKVTEKITQSKYLEESDKRAKQLIKLQIQSIYGEDVKVNFKTI